MNNADKVKQRFLKRGKLLQEYHVELLLALNGKKREKALTGFLNEQFIMAFAVQWETFINDLIQSYVSLSPKRCIESLKTRVYSSLNERFGSSVSKNVQWKPPSQLSVNNIQDLIDPKGMNVSFASAEILAKKANDLLAAQYAKKFSFSLEERNLIDFLVSLRNHLAHNSKKSKQVMRDSILKMKSSSKYNWIYERKWILLSTYLSAKKGDDMRSIKVVNEFLSLAQKL